MSDDNTLTFSEIQKAIKTLKRNNIVPPYAMDFCLWRNEDGSHEIINHDEYIARMKRLRE